MVRSLSDIALSIRKDWKPINFAAKPYLDAMASLDDIDQNYGMDSRTSIVLYFLCNATSWHGPIARQIKKELRNMIK